MARNRPSDLWSDAIESTRLAIFIAQTGIKPMDLARLSGYSRQHLFRLRKGTMEPTRICMVRLAQACSAWLERRVQIHELFDLGTDEPIAALRPAGVLERPGSRWHARLRQAIRESGKTQAEIARRAGIPEETLSRIVRGESTDPRFETIVCIMHAMGSTVGWLLDERGYSISTEQVQRLRDAGAVIAEVAGAGIGG